MLQPARVTFRGQLLSISNAMRRPDSRRRMLHSRSPARGRPRNAQPMYASDQTAARATSMNLRAHGNGKLEMERAAVNAFRCLCRGHCRYRLLTLRNSACRKQH